MAGGMAGTPPFTWDLSQVISSGRDGTCIMRGLRGTRPIAVKRMPLTNVELAQHEIQILEENDAHPNVIRYYEHHQDTNYIYLALELAAGSLNDYVLSPRYREALPPNKVCLQITEGVSYLHSLRMVHRNLKPSNILFVTVTEELILIKITDYAITKILEDTESFTSSSTVGSLSYAAPELLEPGERRTAKADIYSLGHVFYFVLNNGGPVARGLGNLNAIQNGTQRILLAAMVSRNPDARPSAADILVHPAFWDPEKCVQFIQVLSNSAPRGFNFETYRAQAFTGDWTALLDTGLVARMAGHRRYNGNSFGDLIRMLRNLSHHLSEYPDLAMIIGNNYESLMVYVNMRLPNFIYYAWLTGRSLAGQVDQIASFYE
nr:PREDICTED: serine/threonine-protein kinase/endoribonuclease IRE2-like isoform X2 [Bemisia tabaci]XP_018916732.1 PREDICTED: serine/threonine-protein kinase/endoribonuclease IRE2-like isoform X2 [Bemisia tabaci]XP_018916733.1 PREDICTED: serine/threonine-protein kinase/endoribonuclease IRE2-like isoform X2 [Bemisia tabaci]